MSMEMKDDANAGHIHSENASLASGAESSGNDVSTTTCDRKGSTTAGSENTSPEQETIVKAEDKAVLRIRLLVAALLVSLTLGVACLVFYFTRNGEVEAFKEDFHDDADKVFEALGTALDSSLGAVDSFAIAMVSFAKYSNSTWPFVTVPDFGARMSKIRSLSKAFLFGQFQVVEEGDRLEWEKYSIEKAGWVHEVMQVQKQDPTFQGANIEEYSLPPLIYDHVGVVPNNTGPYYPTWQQYPSVPAFFPPFNWDGSSYPSLAEAFDILEQDRKAVIGTVPNLPLPSDRNPIETTVINNYWVKNFVGDNFDHTEPYVDIYYPVFGDDSGLFPSKGTGSSDAKLVSVLSMTFYWRSIIENILPPGSDGIVVVVENTCGQSFTYQINGPDIVYKGPQDRHDDAFDDLVQKSKLTELKEYHSSGSVTYTGFPLAESSCPYSIRIYPSEEYQDRFLTSQPGIYTATAISIFLLTSFVFLLYDSLVERRQKKVMKSVTKSNAIISSLFPSNVRSRLYDMDNESSSVAEPQKNRLKSWLSDGKEADVVNVPSVKYRESQNIFSGRPIADLFPEATVMFADIAGFTAWASIREPSQVFVLLENTYGAFDDIAAKRKVFKVETIGDSYVAVAGLPEPRADHAVVMAKFANDCRLRMTEVTRELGVSLGPDTEDLSMRFGLHSGPVTAGVLRGQKSRFQLFGDTVNTAARMESTGRVNQIQISQVTASCLVKAKKGHWIKPRQDTVEVKGKGMMQTYWVEIKGGSKSLQLSKDSSEMMASHSTAAATKVERLVEWNVDVLARLIRHIVHKRQTVAKNMETTTKSAVDLVKSTGSSNVLGEVKEIIVLPTFDGYSDGIDDAGSIILDPLVLSQLREYVVAIAALYKTNAFHNFEHASHVCMSVAKLMSRIISADDVYDKGPASSKGLIESSKHDHTYGITSDPLTQFACVFSALIHDAEHPGVPNSQLVKEETEMALKYNGRSVAEQNSVNVAWSVFMGDKFSELRSAVCSTGAEMKRFRQLVVNCVMATDIMDKDLKILRNDRWERAFTDSLAMEEPDDVRQNRKATIVIEHLLQASDVAHTMQHWHIYRRWNERLFEEMSRAYQEGRADKDPATFWYQGEMDFFDFYILPLAKKLSECGVFGLSSEEYANYAMKNREEWERRGHEVVDDMVRRMQNNSTKSH